jgi:hypothetical protein
VKQRAVRIVLLVLGGLALSGAAILSMPQDVTLGSTTRLVMFHGSLVWAAILLALLGGGASILLLRRRFSPTGEGQDSGLSVLPALVPWSLSLATLYWLAVLGLSFPVMTLSWGGVLWNEGRLVATMVVVFLYLVAWGVAFIAERPAVAAAGQLVTTTAVLALVVVVPARFHPDNPVFASGNPRFWAGFLLSLAGVLIATAGLVLARVRRPRVEVAPPAPGPPAEVATGAAGGSSGERF